MGIEYNKSIAAETANQLPEIFHQSEPLIMQGWKIYYRLEPRSRDRNLLESLEMKTADPLWMLGRQWQLGELRGEDAATPMTVKIEYNQDVIDHYSAGDNISFKSLAGKPPLEVIVENMPIGLETDWRNRVRIGQQLERLIRQKGEDDAEELIKTLREQYGINQAEVENHFEEKTKRFIKRMAGKVIDGAKIWTAIENEDDIGFDGKELDNWYKQLFFEESIGTTKAWNKEELLHTFKVSNKEDKTSDDCVKLTAKDYQSGNLDWYSFDEVDLKEIPNKRKTFPDDDTEIIATNVQFGGMPNKRLFEMEDGQLDFGRIKPGVKDLSQLMLMEFAMVYSNDWFIVPLDMPIGGLVWIEKITITDVFGQETIIENRKDTVAHLSRDEEEVWDAFKIRPACALANRTESKLYQEQEHFLFVPPVIPHKQEGETLEELWFMRDEYANLVWAKEEIVLSSTGKPVKGFEAHLEKQKWEQLENEPAVDEEDKANNSLPKYRLATTVPNNWIPYVLTGDQMLQRAVMVRNEDDTTDIDSLSTLANEAKEIKMSSIPRAGLRIRLTKQRVRWTDGKTYVWMGRKVEAGKGLGNSGLRFDYLKK